MNFGRGSTETPERIWTVRLKLGAGIGTAVTDREWVVIEDVAEYDGRVQLIATRK
jgi:putative methionine-R-sulfoxide reductase with GAF domain